MRTFENQRYMNAFRSMVLATSVLLTLGSCNQNDDGELEVPSTYEFTRDGVSTVNYAGQTERLDMLELLGNYLRSSNTVGAAALDANVLNDMFRNTNDPFDGQQFGKDLISKCYGPDTTMFLQLLNEAAAISTAPGTASNGLEGVLVEGNSDPNSGYRVNANGLELTQVVLKGLMGAVFYYQAMEVYLSEDRMGTTGNDDLAEGSNYTNMEHYFDEAFGYFGVPTDFPSLASIDEARFYGSYCNKRNENLYQGINDEMATAFRTARAAIAAKDYDARDAAIQTIMQKWSVVIAASAVDYLDQSKPSGSLAVYKRHHAMSEAIGFMLALKYHFNGGNSKYPPHYSFSHVEQALALVGPNTNIYNVSDSDIETAIDHIRGAFPSGEIK